jgi:transcriptional regulator with XRE-family HTH domain
MEDFNFSKAVAILRASRGWSRKKLAEKSGLSISYISRIESKDRDPSLNTVIKLAKALKVKFFVLVALSEIDSIEDSYIKAKVIDEISG